MTTSYINGTVMTEEQANGSFFSSFEDKYLIMDNLDAEGLPTVDDRDEVYNGDYVYVTIVTEGTLNMRVGGTKLSVEANGYLAVMPCMSVKVYESQCKFFCFMTKGYLMNDIYEQTKIGDRLAVRAFCHRQYILESTLTDRLMQLYQKVKIEHLRGNYPMKEQVLRALQTAYLAQLFSFLDPDTYMNEGKKSRQFIFFNEFVELLGKNHKTHRTVHFYANSMSITPKYLSAISQVCAGLSASQVIDQYVIYSVKQALYSNEVNIKTVSSHFNFPSQSFFGRYFKRVTGISPNEYIRDHNRKSLSFEQ